MSQNSRTLLILLIIVAVVIACGLLASALSPALAAYDVFPVWSPDGQAIAFVCYRPFLEITVDLSQLFEPIEDDYIDKTQYAEICSTAPDGSNRRQLTHNRAADYDPVWSPDGAQIAFVSERDGNPALYVMNSDGSQQRRIARTRAVADQVWSPDGKKVAFLQSAGFEDVLTVLDLATGDDQQLVKGPVYFPVWSPDSQAIAFIAGYLHQDQCEVHVVKIDTGDEIALPIMSACERVAWSPNGRHLVFVGPKTDLKDNVLSVLNLQTLETSVVTRNEKRIFDDLIWTPDGNRILYPVEISFPAKSEIFAVNVDGSDLSQITRLDGSIILFGASSNVTLSPDGQQIAFMRGEIVEAPTDSIKIWKINIDGSGLVKLSP